MYLVKYSAWSWGDAHTVDLFVTSDENVADNYINKFNRLLNKWKDYYKQFEDENGYVPDNDDLVYLWYRYYQITEINRCYKIEIELR